MNKRMLVIFSAMFFMGMLLIGNGITGLYLLDFKQPPCDENFDCPESEVCCMFYEKEFGVCDMEDKCDAIRKTTYDVSQSMTTYHSLNKEDPGFLNIMSSHVQAPSKNKTIVSALVGMVLILFALSGYFIGKIRDIRTGRSRAFYRHHKQ